MVREECDASGCGHKAGVSQTVREEDQPSAFNHRLVIIPLLAQISTLLDIHHILLVESRLG